MIDNLELEAAIAQSKLEKVRQEAEELQNELRQARLINLRLETIQFSSEILSPQENKRLLCLANENHQKIKKANLVDAKIQKLQRQIADCMSSDDFLAVGVKAKLWEEQDSAMARISQSNSLLSEIIKLKSDKSFLPEEEILNREEKLKNIRLATATNLSKEAPESESNEVQDRVWQELECTVCYDVPRPNDEVYSCDQHHLMCSLCKHLCNVACPVCRQDFQQIPPKRNRIVEKIIQSLNQNYAKK